MLWRPKGGGWGVSQILEEFNQNKLDLLNKFNKPL
jgi:hypothetical protein